MGNGLIYFELFLNKDYDNKFWIMNDHSMDINGSSEAVVQTGTQTEVRHGLGLELRNLQTSVDTFCFVPLSDLSLLLGICFLCYAHCL